MAAGAGGPVPAVGGGRPAALMRVDRYLLVAGGLAGFFLAGFAAAEAFGVPWLAAPPPLGTQALPVAAAVGVGLLVADAVLPVPASLVMLALGGIFGVAGGAALALAGRVGGTLLAFALGRRLGGRLGGPGERWSRDLLRRWGAVAIVLTRPVPVVGETVAVLAGASPMSWPRAAVAATLGSLPEALLFAWAGAAAYGAGFGAALWIALVGIALALWAVEAVRRRPAARAGPAPP
ncbi:hypothetical protein BJF78_23465 [Pseudonocardia sp. CNS-139]|nr:hypothetical protein BJF78_23465 [Pseudonocardia sp. CNS-139]